MTLVNRIGFAANTIRYMNVSVERLDPRSLHCEWPKIEERIEGPGLEGNWHLS